MKFLIILVAMEHLFIAWIEMFSWTNFGKKVFKSMPENMFELTEGMAKNQGLYNGFLAFGLLWSVIIKDPIWARNIAMFFLSCVSIAGIYGAVTVDKKIFFKQALPALIVLAGVCKFS